MKKKLLFLFSFLLIFLYGCYKAPTPNDFYKIAVVAPQSGPYSKLGESIINGVQLAVEETNENGGIGGKKVLLIKEDDGGLVGKELFLRTGLLELK